MAKLLKNTSGSAVTLAGVGISIPASSTLTVDSTDYDRLQQATNLSALITAGTIVVNDGLRDLSVASGLKFIRVDDFSQNIRFRNSTDSANTYEAEFVEGAIEESVVLGWLGSGTDGAVSLSSGTTTLTRTMFYESLTLSSAAIINTNGFKIFVRNALTLSGTANIHNNGAAGNAAVNSVIGAGTVGTPGYEVGSAQAGGAGAVTPGGDSASQAAQSGYGGSGGAGGGAGGNLTGMGVGGVVNYYPEQTLNMHHFSGPAGFKSGGGGGSGGNAGINLSPGAGGGGGAGGGVVFIVCRTLDNTSSVGITAKGGAGGAGGAGFAANSNGGGGGGGGGGGFIYLITNTITNLGTISVAGGAGGAAGAKTGIGVAGLVGTAGSTGHYSIFSAQTGAWTIL